MWSTVMLMAIAGMAPAERTQATLEKRLIPPQIVRFEVVLGRLRLSPEYFRIGAAHERQMLEDGRQRTRSISISVLHGEPTLKFSDQGGDEEIQLSFNADHQVDIRVHTGRGGDSQKLTYHQPCEGPLAVRVESTDGRAALQFEARSLWHLAIDQPEFFEAYLSPCLARLDGSWDFARNAAAVRSLQNNSVRPSDLQLISKMVEQLAAGTAAERHSATLQLEGLGLAAELPLRAALTADLSSQQRAAIHKLLDAFQPTGHDTPMRIAVWLSGERRI